MSQAHEETIQQMYAAFGRGDVAAIQERVSSDTRWDYNVAPSEVPWHVPVAGRSDLPRFFAAFGQGVKLESFEVLGLVSAGDDVVARIAIAYAVAKTGKRVAMEQVHWWRFDPRGQVASLRHFEDTAAVRDAHR